MTSIVGVGEIRRRPTELHRRIGDRSSQHLRLLLQRLRVDLIERGDADELADLGDLLLDAIGDARVLVPHDLGEDGLPGELDAIDIVLHVEKRGAADRRFPAFGLALAELEGEQPMPTSTPWP